MKTQSPLLKKVITLFIIVLIPLISISIIFFHQSNIQQKEQALSAIENSTDAYIAHLDDSLKQIYFANLHILEQNLIEKLNVSYPYLSIYERSTTLNSIRDQLYSICSASAFLDSAHLHLFNYNRVYSSTTFERGSFHSVSEEENVFYQTLAAQKGLFQYYKDPFTEQNELAVFMTPPFQDSSYAINMVLSQTALQKYLETNSAYDSELYLFSLQNGFALTNVPDNVMEDSFIFLSEHSDPEIVGYEEIKLNGETYIAFYTHTFYSGGTYIRFIPVKSLGSSIHYSYWLMILFYLFTITTCICFFIGIFKLVHKPLSALTDAFKEVENGNFQIQIDQNGNSEFAYLYQAFNNMSTQLNLLIERDYQQTILLQKAEMKQLQAQINPHFLYNSFFMLQRMIKSDSDGAQEMAAALASFFRYITKNSMDNVTLREEYEHVKNYTYIQGLRFDGRIRIELDELPDAFSQMPVPKLILQPILENIFKYGLNNKMSDGLIRVQFFTGENFITIQIEDNGEELQDETLLRLQKQLSSSVCTSDGMEMSGILNIQRRLHIFSNYKDALHVSRSALGGLCVEIILQPEKEVHT